jgi:hypothetical protein
MSVRRRSHESLLGKWIRRSPYNIRRDAVPRWHAKTQEVPFEGDGSPISLLSMDCHAPEISICDPKRRQERTEELADSSVPSNHDTEHEKATFEAEHALKGQEATESLHESYSNLQRVTQCPPDSTRYDDLEVEPRETPDVHSGDGGEERSDETDCYEKNLEEATNSALDLASSVEGEQNVAQPLVQNVSEEGGEDERIDGDEGDEEEQTEQVEEEKGASSARRVEGSDDGVIEAPETPHIEPEPISNEERLQEDAQGYRAYDSTRLAGGVNNAHDPPSTEELVNVQGTASPSKTSVMPVPLDDVVSTPRRELKHGMETGQVISNDLVAIRANAAKEQAEQSGLTTHHRDDMEEAQSHRSGGVCDEEKIVVANGSQRGPRSNGGVVDSRTKDTPGTGGRIHDLMDAGDSSSDVEEDSDDTGPKGNTPNHIKPRAKRAYNTNLGILETPKKRRKTLIHFTEQMTCSAVNNIPDSLIQPPQIPQLITGMLDRSHKHDMVSLTSFFFAIGSPYAIKNFREACQQVRNVQVSGPFPEETGARRSTRTRSYRYARQSVSNPPPLSSGPACEASR